MRIEKKNSDIVIEGQIFIMKFINLFKERFKGNFFALGNKEYLNKNKSKFQSICYYSLFKTIERVFRWEFELHQLILRTKYI